MYAIAFDLDVSILRRTYGDPYNNAYFEVRRELETLGFKWTQGSVYLYDGESTLTAVYKAIDTLRAIDWFRQSVRDIRAFKVEDWSDFTSVVRGGNGGPH
ncbi:Virulence-associated protein D -like protein [Rhodovulum sp. PH10]|uniref:virulence protein n=1 Tax=Rhodovulum sp. PH10 TaxID=1187851 RepID=UPI00027C1F49|nr:virulence protein [Rhodovulum sp. PH10]EJW09502.1 Virulence-associated protein D -like protein [Rhodovulum sp. PH10]